MSGAARERPTAAERCRGTPQLEDGSGNGFFLAPLIHRRELGDSASPIAQGVET